LLQCTEGVGLVVTRDGTAIRLRAGDTVWTPAGEEHPAGTVSSSSARSHRPASPGIRDHAGLLFSPAVSHAGGRGHQRAHHPAVRASLIATVIVTAATRWCKRPASHGRGCLRRAAGARSLPPA